MNYPILGLPKLLTYGLLEENNLNFLVISKYDADLEKMFARAGRKFSY